jgi:hypothetical protein
VSVRECHHGHGGCSDGTRGVNLDVAGYEQWVGEQAHVWPCIVSSWNEWLNKCIHTVRDVQKLKPPRVVLYTDASDSGWGAVAFHQPSGVVCAGGDMEHIFSRTINQRPRSTSRHLWLPCFRSSGSSLGTVYRQHSRVGRHPKKDVRGR